MTAKPEKPSPVRILITCLIIMAALFIIATAWHWIFE